LGERGLAPLPAPGAGAYALAVRKAWPESIDEWTHFLHGPDCNPVARDRVVGPPKHYRWISEPMWQRSHETDSSISSLVTAAGRLFTIVDQAPTSLPGQHPLPDKWSLTARDAFNGVLLWRVPIRRWGWREWKDTWFTARPGDFPLNLQKRLVAVGDRVYATLGYHAPVSQLDARSGDILQTYAGTERTNEILFIDNTLVLSVLSGEGVRVLAVNAETGDRLWESGRTYGGSTVDYIKFSSRYAALNVPHLDPAPNMATDGKAIALIDGADIVCLDVRTGAERWRTPFPSAAADEGAGGVRADGNLWVGTVIVSDDMVIHASPSKLAAFDTQTGQVAWEQPKRYIGHLWYEWKDVFVIDGLVWTWSEELDEGEFDIGRGRPQRTRYPRTANGYDVKTGELKKQVDLGNIFKAHHHHRCYRNKATSRYILASRRGTEYVSLDGGTHTVHNWVRGTCHLGMMPANGLQYAPPHPCACYIDEKLNGMNALAPEIPDEYKADPGDEHRTQLEAGPATGSVESLEAGPEDWPSFRCDSMRTGSVQTTVPTLTGPVWRVDLGGRLSAPVAVGNRVFVSLVDAHHVVCLSAETGEQLWETAAGGRIDSPPTYYRGTVIFGANDGTVTCVRASDGVPVWRFRAAPSERMIAAFGQFESAWPVPGSVLVQDGAVYFACGRSSQLDGGIVLYGLDAGTGALRCTSRLSGPDYKASDFEENFKLPMGALPDILMGDGERIYMRTLAFDNELVREKGRAQMQARSGMRDDSYFKRTPWTFDEGKTRNYARLIVHDQRSVFYVRMFDSLRGLDPTVFFTPGRKGYLLFARNLGENAAGWSLRVPVRIRAMVLTADSLIVAGPPDVVAADDPLGSFEARKGGVLTMHDAASGEKRAEIQLESPPVFNGAAAAQGRLFLTEENGTLACYGSR
jgi:outer membrane protein assembly factor BamB